jgi:hypothetical protein
MRGNHHAPARHIRQVLKVIPGSQNHTGPSAANSPSSADPALQENTDQIGFKAQLPLFCGTIFAIPLGNNIVAPATPGKFSASSRCAQVNLKSLNTAAARRKIA